MMMKYTYRKIYIWSKTVDIAHYFLYNLSMFLHLSNTYNKQCITCIFCHRWLNKYCIIKKKMYFYAGYLYFLLTKDFAYDIDKFDASSAENLHLHKRIKFLCITYTLLQIQIWINHKYWRYIKIDKIQFVFLKGLWLNHNHITLFGKSRI